jgi:Subtilase family
MNMPDGGGPDYQGGPCGAPRNAEARHALRRRARHAELCEGGRDDGEGAIGQPGVLEGPGFLYRPRQVLVEAGTEHTQKVVRRLQLEGGVPDDELGRGFAAAKLPVQAYLMPPEVDIPRLVAQLREHEDGEPIPNVGPNHVFCGEADYHGGPYGEPLNASPFSETPYAKPTPGAPGIAILDTGYDPSVPALHAGLGWRVDYPAGETENPLTPSGYLAQEGGHGTFVDGVIMRLAPQVRIRQVRVLDPAGVTDDACVAQAITTQANAPVINLSLGGYTQQDVPPVASGVALAQLDASVAVVAAAGNNSSPRRFWPATFNRVVAVGALDTTNGQQALAGFSNCGDWVDIYAPGVNVYSTYLAATWKLPTDPTSWFIDGWAFWNGTSFAAPQVAAAIADTMRQTGGTARQAALAVLAAAQWVPGANGWPGGWGYLPQPGVIG